MPEIILLAVIQKAVEIVGYLAVQQVSRLSKVKEDMEWIVSEMGYIQSYLEDADAKQGGNRAVATFVTDIRVLGLDVEDIMDTYLPKIASPKKEGFFGRLRRAHGIFGYVHTIHNFAAEIDGIRRRVNDIKDRRQRYGIEEKSGNDTWDARQSFPHVDEPNVVGFEGHMEKLVGMLNNDSQCGVISITRMAGLGKTTLAKKVYNSVQQSFECSAWICVSQQPNTVELLRDVARQLGLHKDKWEHNVHANLFKFLRDKRYVVVIDDLWKIESWDDLMTGIPNNSKSGGRIILTSRNIEVGKSVGGQSSLYELQLQLLDIKNSRNLFSKMVERSLENPPFDNLGEQILKRCGGVPLTIVLTAGMLRERTEHEWKRLLENMGQEKDKCSKIFALSYKDLPTELKPCFLYFGIFPEDYEILAFDLINLWAAEGFIRGSDTQEVEEVGNDHLNHLFARNLIKVTRRKFDGRIKRLRIHDILHGLCVTEAKEINFFNTPNAATVGNSVTKVRRVTTNHECISSFNNYGTPKLRAMLFFNGEDWGVDNFPRDLRLLRVISLECQRVAFPLPSEIGNLRNLLTLDVRLCTLLKFPYFIWKMKQLRHVLLSHQYFMKYYYNIELSSQKQLLNMGKFHHPIEEEETFANLRTLFWVRVSDLLASFCKFTNLRKLGIFFTCINFSKLKEFLDADIVSHKLEILHLKCGDIDAKNHSKMLDLNLSRYENLFKLHLNRFKVELSRHNQLPPNLTKLTLRYTWLKEDPMETLKKLPKLEILELGYYSYIGKKLMVCSGEGGPSDCFPKLQVLEVDGSSGLNEFLVEEATIPKLSKLTMRYCYRLNMKVPDRIKDIMVRY